MRVIRSRRLLLILSGLLLGTLLIALTLLAEQDVEGGFNFQPMWLFGLHNSSEANDIACYFDEAENAAFDIESTVVPKNSIFFHETSCHTHSGPLFTARQACAIESAAKMNPEMHVFVLFPSPINFGRNSSVNDFYHQLKSYENIHIHHVKMEKYFQDTPLEDWYKNGHLLTSRWPRSHASDLLRYLTLWKFGGIYLDLDVVVVKSLKGLINFAGAESDTDVAAGVMSFSQDGNGHEMASQCLQDLKNNFRGNDWGNNGPGVITRVLKKTCKVRKVKDMTVEQCNGFQVYPPEWFYPIPWRQWHQYFEINNTQSIMATLEKSKVIHVWNKFSTSANITVGSNQPYGVIASKYCPRVYSSCGSIF